MKTSGYMKAGALLAITALLTACTMLAAPFKEADPRWADYKSWTRVTELAPSTGDPTRSLGGVHMGDEGYREVYVNAIARQALLGPGPYNLPAGSVIVKEQFANQADWQANRKAAHTVSIKVARTDKPARDNWIWADSYKGTAGESAFCSVCHSIAANSDFVFTTGDFLENRE